MAIVHSVGINLGRKTTFISYEFPLQNHSLLKCSSGTVLERERFDIQQFDYRNSPADYAW